MTERFSWDGAEDEAAVSPWARDHHVVDLVDFHDQTVTQLSEGPGIVHVVWAGDGGLLLESSEATWRHAAKGGERVEDIPVGVHFGTPPFPEEGGV